LILAQGHVDTTATLTSIKPDGNSLRLLLTLPSSSPPSHLFSLIPKGYVTLDGTSLTLTSVDASSRTFGVMLIAHTQEKVILSKKKVGDRVNVEFDVVAKGVEAIVSNILGSSSNGQESGSGNDGGFSALEQMVERVVEKVLARKTNQSS